MPRSNNPAYDKWSPQTETTSGIKFLDAGFIKLLQYKHIVRPHSLKGPYFTPFWDLIWGIGYPKMMYQWLSSLLPLSGALWSSRGRLFRLPLEPLLWLADCTSEAGLGPAGWGWETSAIQNDSYGGGSRKWDVSIAYFFEWTEWKSLRTDCFHNLRVPTNHLQVITDSKSPENVFTQYGPFKLKLCTYPQVPFSSLSHARISLSLLSLFICYSQSVESDTVAPPPSLSQIEWILCETLHRVHQIHVLSFTET